MRNLKRLAEGSLSGWVRDDVPRLAAALAFYSLLSLSPLVVVVVGVAGLVFGRAAAGGQLAIEIQRFVGSDGARVIQSIVDSARTPRAGLVAGALSILMLLFGASSVVVELRAGLNTIWHVPSDPGVSNLRAIWQMGKERFYSFALVIGAGVLLLLSVAISAAITGVSRFASGRFAGGWLQGSSEWVHTGAFLVSYVIIAVLFAAIYRAVPEVTIQWGDVAIGAAVTALIFALGKQLVAIYLAKAAFGSTYGAAGSFVVFLIWVYYSAQLFFLGAEFTKMYAETYGSHARRAPPVPDVTETKPER